MISKKLAQKQLKVDVELLAAGDFKEDGEVR